MYKNYKVALIGCGLMGAAHLDDIYCNENITVAYVCDLDISKANDFKKRYNAKEAITDYNIALKDPEVDIVIIATYAATHYQILSDCIKHGKHVLCEKPFSTDMESAKKMVDLVKSNPQIKVHFGYILRHNKTYQKVAEMIKSGAIGKPIVMRMVQNHHAKDWQRYLNLLSENSPLIDCGVHYIDVMRWFTDAEVTDINAIGAKTESDVPDGMYNYGLMTVKMSDGSIAYYEAGWSNTISADNLKEFVGPKGRIRIILQDARYEHREEGDLIEYYTYPDKKYEIINCLCKRKPTGAQLEDLIDMIETNSSGSPTIDDAWESFRVANLADEKARKYL